MGVIAASEAARILGVDARQVRRLAQEGKVVGRRTSAGWLLEEDSVRDKAARPAPAGRPVSPERAWMIIQVLEHLAETDPSGTEHGDVLIGALKALPADPATKHRLRQRMAHIPDHRTVANWLAHRAEPRRVRVHPGVLDELSADTRVAVGGARALSSLAGVAEGSEPLTLYVGAADEGALVREYRAKEDPRGNVKFQVMPGRIPSELRPKPASRVPAAVAYVDALDSDDARAREVATAWLEHLRVKVAARGKAVAG